MYIHYIRQFSQEKLATLTETLMRNCYYRLQIDCQMHLQLIFSKLHTLVTNHSYSTFAKLVCSMVILIFMRHLNNDLKQCVSYTQRKKTFAKEYLTFCLLLNIHLKYGCQIFNSILAQLLNV